MEGLASYYQSLNRQAQNQQAAVQFFQRQDYWYRKQDPTSEVLEKLMEEHPDKRLTSFCGGTVFFPFETQAKSVLSLIAQDIEAGHPLFWNQIGYDKPGQGVRFVVDIDCDSRVLPPTEINLMGQVLFQTLKAYFGCGIPIFIATCGPRLKKGVLSLGIHLIAHVKVTIAQAQQIIFGYRCRLLKNPRLNMAGVEVDPQIYKIYQQSVCLRMIYSHKLENCPLCLNRQEQRVSCDFCEQKGLVIAKKTYQPVMSIDPATGLASKDHFTRHHQNFAEIVRHYSLWHDPEQDHDGASYAKPVKDPTFSSPTKKEGKKKILKRKRKLHPEAKTMRQGEEGYTLLEEEIHRLRWRGQTHYESVIIDAIHVRKTTAQIYLEGIGSSYCLYANKDHGTNRVWFSLNDKGKLTFRCNSQKQEYGVCKHKHNITFEIPSRVVSHIFDNVTQPPTLYPRKKIRDSGVFNFQAFWEKQAGATDHNSSQRESKRDKNLAQLRRLYKLHEQP